MIWKMLILMHFDIWYKSTGFFIISVAKQNSRIDADHTANTKLYSDRPTKQNFINVCGLNLNLKNVY